VQLLRNRGKTKNVSGDYLKSLHEKRTGSFVRVEKISAKRDLGKAFAIRIRVFVKEQGVPAEIELDRDDKRAIHFLAAGAGKAVGTARVVMQQKTAKIGRMAVLKSHRRKGVGMKLLRRSVAAAKKLGARKIYLHAQVPVIGFYETFGFHCVGPVFDEAGIPHRKMILGGKGK
jgi:predicted GNAT family N-acyltransferase